MSLNSIVYLIRVSECLVCVCVWVYVIRVRDHVKALIFFSFLSKKIGNYYCVAFWLLYSLIIVLWRHGLWMCVCEYACEHGFMSTDVPQCMPVGHRASSSISPFLLICLRNGFLSFFTCLASWFASFCNPSIFASLPPIHSSAGIIDMCYLGIWLYMGSVIWAQVLIICITSSLPTQPSHSLVIFKWLLSWWI